MDKVLFPISPEMKTSRAGFGYVITTTTSLPLPTLVEPNKYLFVVGGIQTEEQHPINCVEHIDEMGIPELETIVVDDIVVDVQGDSTSDPIPFVPTKQKYKPYHKPHKNKSSFPMNPNSWTSGIHVFRYLQKRRETLNHGPMLPIKVYCGSSDEWYWRGLNKCLRSSYWCILSILHPYNHPISCC